MLILRARKNLELHVSKEQVDILIGCILGDAYIERRGKIQIEHSGAQKDYTAWKYEKLQSISYGSPKKVIRTDNRNGKEYSSYRFWTRQFFRSWRDRFYPDGKKIIPSDLQDLSPVTMAIWYMDDGSLADNKRIVLSTDSFDEKSHERLLKLLKSSFGVRSSLKGSGKILIGTRDAQKLIARIKPYIHKSMAYKIP